MKYASKTLQEKLKREILNEQSLQDFLEKNQHHIFHLKLYNSNQCCDKEKCKMPQNSATLAREHFQLLYSKDKEFCDKSTGKGVYCYCCFVPDPHVDISKWDITLTSCILFEILPKKCLSQPAKRAIESLREIRNSLLHKGDVFMSDDEYLKTFDNVSNNIEEVAKTCGDGFFLQTICKEIQKLKRKRPCLRILKEAQEYLRELKRVDNDIVIINYIYIYTMFVVKIRNYSYVNLGMI